MIELTRSQIAELRGCTPSTVSRAHLPKTSGGNYDLSDSVVLEWVISPALDERIRQMKRMEAANLGSSDKEELDLENSKLNAAWKYEQTEILRLKKAEMKKDLVPIDLVAAWLGPFANGLRMFFFPIGKRVSPNDKKTQLKYEKELTKAIEKTFEMADRELLRESQKLVEAIQEHD